MVGVDNFITGNPANLDHLKNNPNYAFQENNVSEHFEVAGDVDFIFHFASPASPIDYLELPIQTLKVGSLGTHNALGLAKAKGAGLAARLDVGMLRRSARPPADRGVLGQRESDRAARRL